MTDAGGNHSSPLLQQALSLARLGYWVFPCQADKRPCTPHGKDDASKDPAIAQGLFKRYPGALLIGINCKQSGIFALDIDLKDGRDGMRSWTELVEAYGNGTNVTVGPCQLTKSGGYHLVFRDPEGLQIPNNANKLGAGLDLRSNGYICTGPGYTWMDGHGPDAPITDAPAWLLSLIRKMGERKDPQPSHFGNSKTDGAGEYWLDYYLKRAQIGNRNETGYYLSLQLRDSGLSEGEAANYMRDYARSVPQNSRDPYTEQAALKSLHSAFGKSKREPAHIPGLSNGRSSYHPEPEHQPDMPENPPTISENQNLTPEDDRIHLTDMGNARRFTANNRAQVKYYDRWGWMIWSGKRWERDERGAVMQLAKRTARILYSEAERSVDQAKVAIRTIEAAQDADNQAGVAEGLQTKKDAERQASAILAWAIKSQSKPRLDAMLSLAQSEPEICANAQDFDSDPWLLNCQNGIVNLKTGELMPHKNELMMTKIGGASYDPEAQCPQWLAFLDRIFNGNRDLINFIQRATGYSLTGITNEQCLFFPYGTGRNGKSTFTGILESLLGDYACKTPTDTLMAKHYDSGIPNDLARLPGARAVIAAEMAEGRRLNEPLVKDLTGQDTITARFLHREYFEFVPQFKLWMYGNHKPVIKGTDEGIWRRIRLIPFTVTITDQECDPYLPDKLKGELDGILAWAVCGCLEWQRSGLQAPTEVVKATEAYRAESDVLAAFFEECCIISDLAQVTAGELWQAFKSWTERTGENPTNQRRFSQAMAERGYITQGRNSKGQAIYKGIGLITTEAITEA